MKVKCVGRESGCRSFSIGGVYKVEKDGLGYYILCAVGDKLYFDLETGKCSWFNARLNSQHYTFEEVKEQPKYATSPEVLAQVFKKMADNILVGLDPCEGIQFKVEGALWCGTREVNHLEEFEYRVKPDTITLKNGIEVPKPLDVVEIPQLERTTKLFIPVAYDKGYTWAYVAPLCERAMGCPTGSLFYATKEEAIQASVALFGLEVKG